MSTIEKQIGSRIAATRKYNGVSQIELSKITKIPSRKISAYENGTVDIVVKDIVILAEALKIPVVSLITENETDESMQWRERYEREKIKYSTLVKRLEDLVKKINTKN